MPFLAVRRNRRAPRAANKASVSVRIVTLVGRMVRIVCVDDEPKQLEFVRLQVFRQRHWTASLLAEVDTPLGRRWLVT